ncbi:MAG: eL43 family ribosomal protein [Planctomycetota bacterium]|jgi:hypothetical protein
MGDERALVKTEREGALAQTGEPQTMAVAEVEAQMQSVYRLMGKVMVKGEDYDVIPGTDKPSLLQPGAEKLGVMFRIAPKYEIKEKDLGNGHREYQSHCTLTHIPTGRFLGEAYGLCSTMETRYRWRQKKRVCPHCGQETVIKGKEQYGGGWLCWKGKGGCGAKWRDGDPVIEGQEVGRIENPDIADNHHTALAISQKRSYVRGVRNATAASAIFTDSTEELEQGAPPEVEPDREPRNQRTQEADDFFDGDLSAAADRDRPKTYEERRMEVCNWLKDLGFTKITLGELAQKEGLEPDPRKWSEEDLKKWADIAVREDERNERARQGR